jgi:hypothetical protein
MKKLMGAVTAAILLLGLLAGTAGCKTTTSTTTTTTKTTLTTTQTTIVYGNAASSQSTNVLTLSLGLDGTVYKAGQPVYIAIEEDNHLDYDLAVPSVNAWAYQKFSLGPCGINGEMYAFAVFKGNYTLSDITNLTPLYFYDYTIIPPCALVLPVSSYVFSAKSDTVTTQYGQYPARLETSISGFWAGDPKAIKQNFEPGVYTVVAGDQWGSLVVVHFTVTN